MIISLFEMILKEKSNEKRKKNFFFFFVELIPKRKIFPKGNSSQKGNSSKTSTFPFFLCCRFNSKSKKMSVKVAGFKSSELFQQIKEGVESLPAEERAGNAKKVRIPPNFAIFFFLQVQGVIFGLQGSWALLPLGSLILLSLSFSRSLEFSSLTLRAMMARSSPGLSMPRLPLAPSPPAPLPSPTSPSSSPMLTSLTSPLESSTARRPSCPARSRSRAR